VKEIATALQAELAAEFTGIEDGVTILVSEAELPEKVVSEADRDNALRYVLGIIDGVHTMSAYVDGLVESSSNLGVFRIDAEGVSATSYTRSSDPERFLEIEQQMTSLAEDCGFAWSTTKTADAWPYNPDNKLLPLVREVYLALNGEPIREVSVHAGLECGTFALLNPALNMISIGPDLKDVHSTAETLYLSSIPKTWRLLEGILLGLPQA
jgi:dipeptidase D